MKGICHDSFRTTNNHLLAISRSIRISLRSDESIRFSVHVRPLVDDLPDPVPSVNSTSARTTRGWDGGGGEKGGGAEKGGGQRRGGGPPVISHTWWIKQPVALGNWVNSAIVVFFWVSREGGRGRWVGRMMWVVYDWCLPLWWRCYATLSSSRPLMQYKLCLEKIPPF